MPLSEFNESGPPEMKLKNSVGADVVEGGWTVVAPPKSVDPGILPVFHASRSVQKRDSQRMQTYFGTESRSCRRPLLSNMAWGGRTPDEDERRHRTVPREQPVPLLQSPSDSALLAGVIHVSNNKRALLIGINYTDTKRARKLTNCVNDTKWMYRLLVEKFSFRDEDISVMTDEPIELPSKVQHFHPTRKNILTGMRWLVRGATSNDSLFFHFSGHGSQIPDANGDELDGWDETILPVDFPAYGQNGHIVDDEIHSIMVRGLCNGARLTALFDCCNSATIMDLPFVHSPHGGVSGLVHGTAETRIRPVESVVNAKDDYKYLVSLVGRKMCGRFRKAQPESEAVQRASALRIRVAKQICNNGLVIAFSACSDHEKSADVFGKAGPSSNGAMTYAFVQAVTATDLSSGGLSLQSLLNTMRETLTRSGHSQVPHLSLSHNISLKTPFSL